MPVNRTAAQHNAAYGIRHQRERKHLVAAAINTRCPLCRKLMVNPKLMEADHTPALMTHHHVPDSGCCTLRILCRTCNRSTGAAQGNRARSRAGKRRETRATTITW